MRHKRQVQEYKEALDVIARATEKGHPLRKEAVKLVREEENGEDLSKYMRNVRFQCLDCLEVFDTRKECATHIGMYNGSCDPRDSTPRVTVDCVDHHINQICPGP